MNRQEAGQFVRHLRDKQRELGLSQNGMAALLGLHKSHVSRLYRGHQGPTLWVMRQAVAQWPEFALYVAADLQAECRGQGGR